MTVFVDPEGYVALPKDASSLLPSDAQARKGVPIYSGFLMYFPRAVAAVAELSRIGNDQHNPGQPLHWDRSKSGDEKDALMRHLMEAGTVDNDGVRHSTKAAWRAMANLEKELEQADPSNGDVGAQVRAELEECPEELLARFRRDWGL